MPIVIDFLANVRSLLKGTSDAERAFADVAESLDDLARDGAKAGDKLGDEIEDGARDADRAVEKLEAGFKDMADASRRESSKAGKDLGDNITRGTKEAEGGLRDFKDESKSTAKESAASFDGSAESIIDAFQEVAANAFVGFGPAGLVAGLAVAAGIGVGALAIEQSGEDAEQLRQVVADLAAELIEVGSDSPGLDYLVGRLKEMASETEEGRDSLADLRTAAQDAGVPFDRLAVAYAGNTRALDAQIAKLREQQRGYQESGTATRVFAEGTETAANRQYTASQKIVAGYEQTRDTIRKAQDEETAWIEAGGPQLEARGAALEEYADTTQDALTDAGRAWEDYTHDGIVSLDEYNAAIEAQAAAIQAYQGNVVTATQTLSAEALNYIIALGPEAAPLLQAYVDAPLEQKERTAANWGVLGAAAATSYTNDLKAGIPSEIPGPTIVARVDLDQAYADMEQFKNTNYNVGVGVLLRPGSPVD